MEQLSFDQRLCACGCGDIPPVGRHTNKRAGLIKGQPTRFIKGHSRRLRIDDSGRQCGACREFKPWGSFHISRTTAYGHVTTCKTCMAVKAAAATKARQAARPPKLKPETCEFPECGGRVRARVWCRRHYENWRASGDPAVRASVVAARVRAEARVRPDLPGENWRPVPTYEGLYEVSDQGRVYSLLSGKILKGDHSDTRGYIRMGLVRPGSRKQEKHSLHRLVLWTFTGENPPDLQTRHLDGNPANNTLANLAWGTASENAHDRVRHGTWVNNNRFVNATHCIHGHEFDEANTYWRPGGGRSCRQCMRDNHQRRKREAA